mgnify:CR=1 FL=1
MHGCIIISSREKILTSCLYLLSFLLPLLICHFNSFTKNLSSLTLNLLIVKSLDALSESCDLSFQIMDSFLQFLLICLLINIFWIKLFSFLFNNSIVNVKCWCYAYHSTNCKNAWKLIQTYIISNKLSKEWLNEKRVHYNDWWKEVHAKNIANITPKCI